VEASSDEQVRSWPGSVHGLRGEGCLAVQLNRRLKFTSSRHKEKFEECGLIKAIGIWTGIGRNELLTNINRIIANLEEQECSLGGIDISQPEEITVG
jgi:hypothetical protein